MADGIELLARWADQGAAHGGGVTAVAVSRDGKLAASGSWDQTVRIWNYASGETLKVLTEAEPYPLCLAFSPDGQRLAAGLDSGYEETIVVWSLDTYEVLWACRGHYRTASLAFSPDGAALVSGGGEDDGGRLILWDAATGAERWAVDEGWEDEVTQVAFSPDGRAILAGRTGGPGEVAGQIELRSSADGKLLWSAPGPYRAAGLSPDGRFAFSCDAPEGPLRLVDAATGAEFGLFEGRNAVGLDVAGKLVPAYLAPKAPEKPRYWEGSSGIELDPRTCRLVFAAGPSFVAPAPDGRSALACPRGEYGFAAYDLVEGKARWTAKAPDAIVAVAYSPDGRRILGARRSNEVFLLDVMTGAVLWHARAKGEVQRLTFSPDGRYAFALVAWTSRQLWETSAGAEVAIGKDCDLAAVLPDGTLLVGSLDLADPKLPALRRVNGEGAVPSAEMRFFHSRLPVLEDGSTIVIPAGAEERLLLRNLLTGWQKGLKGKALHKDDSLLSAARSPDGRRLATADKKLTAVWDLESGRQTDNHGSGPCSAVSRDAALLLRGGGSYLRLFEAASLKKEAAKCRLDPGDSFACAAFGDGGLFVAGTAKGLILHGRASFPAKATEPETPPPPPPKLPPSGSPGVSVLYVGPPERGGTDDPEHWLAAGDGHRAQGELEQAAACYRKATELDPKWESAWAAWSRCLDLMKRFDEACAVADQALALDPGNAVHLTNKGMHLLGAGRFEEALAVLEQAVRAAPKDAAPWLFKAGCEVTLGRLLPAARSRFVLRKLPLINEAQKTSYMRLCEWIYEEVKKRSASFDLASRAVEQGRLAEALPLFDAAMAEFPEWSESWAAKGLTLYKLGRFEEALPVLERADALDATMGAWRNRMICLSRLGRDAEGLASVQRRLEAEPADAEAWCLQGMFLRRMRRLKEAVVSFSKALQYDPDNREVLRFRAQTIKELSESNG